MNNTINTNSHSSSSSLHQIRIQKPPISTTNSIAIDESLQTSIQNLLKNWRRRQQWKKKLFFITQSNQINPAPWRKKLTDFLESKKIRYISIFLILVDLILTTLELSSSLISCDENKHKNKNVNNHNHSEVERLGPTKWYHWVGIAILGLLFSKTVAMAVGLRSAIIRRPGYVVDGVVLAVALVLEIFLEGKGGGFLVVVSLWRVVRVVESAFELSDDAIEAQIKSIVAQFESLREENMRLLEVNEEKDKMIEKLVQDLERCRKPLEMDHISAITFIDN
uniref:Voltage-gated hydrogen channel 1 n=1 Tax=Cannabis sativa TaxID=3483 RepID=A0A803Q5W4_CANSA